MQYPEASASGLEHISDADMYKKEILQKKGIDRKSILFRKVLDSHAE